MKIKIDGKQIRDGNRVKLKLKPESENSTLRNEITKEK